MYIVKLKPCIANGINDGKNNKRREKTLEFSLEFTFIAAKEKNIRWKKFRKTYLKTDQRESIAHVT